MAAVTTFLIGALMGLLSLALLFLCGVFLIIRASRDYDASEKPTNSTPDE